ncbi:MAG: protein kinase [Myxococcota bacterium]
MRALGNDGATETFTGILDQPAGKQVIVRKVLPGLARDPAQLATLRSRVGDLKPIRHAQLLSLLDAFEEDGSLYLVQEWVDGVSLAEVVRACNESGEGMPLNVFLNLAVQICNGLEALHSQPGIQSGARHVLHLSVRPESILLTRDGDVLLGDYGLVRSPAQAAHSGGIRLKTAYLSPEQTHQDQKLTPASDLFSLGAVLYELLTFQPMFRDSTPLKTLARVRRAEVTTQLLEVKEIFPGLDRVLYRALSLNQRHRYQRAFVLREDLRGLMAGFSFSNIQGEARAFLEPLFQGRTRAIDEVLPPLPPSPNQENTNSLLDDPMETTGDSRSAPSGSRTAPSGSRTAPPYSRTGTRDSGRDSFLRDDPDIDTAPSFGARSAAVLGTDPVDRGLERAFREAMERDGDTGPTGSFDPAETQPFARESMREPSSPGGPVGPVGLGPSDLADLGFAGSLATDSEELDLLRANGSMGFGSGEDVLSGTLDPDPPERAAPPEPRRSFLPPPPALLDEPRAATPAPASRNVPAGSDTQHGRPAARISRTPDPVVPVDDETGWDRRGPSGPLIAGALLAGALGLMVVVCAGGSLLGALGASRAVGTRSVAQEPEQVVALPAEVPAPSTPEAAVAASPKAAPDAPLKVGPVAASPKTGRPAPVASAPRPAGIARTASPTPRPRDVPSAAPARTAPAEVRPVPAPIPMAAIPVSGAADPTLSDADWDVDMLVSEKLSPLEMSGSPAAVTAPENLGDYATAAYAGQLTTTDQAALATVERGTDDFTRARILLYQDAKARGDHSARRRWMADVMSVEANTYRPELLVEQAALAMADRDYEVALEHANRAEQYWSRLPSELLFTRKAMIHEIQAQASWALYTRSDPPREAWLDGAIDAWTRYRSHVLGAKRTDLVSRADERLAHLRDVRSRMH